MKRMRACEVRRCRMFSGCLVYCSMRLGVPFIAPRDLEVVRALFGRLWLPSVRGCTGLSGAHQTVNSARDGRDTKSSDWLISCSGGGTGPSGVRHRSVRCATRLLAQGRCSSLSLHDWHTGLSGASHGRSSEL
jgi:hypothetical protein